MDIGYAMGIPPSEEVQIEMADIEKLHESLTSVLVATAEIRETLRLQEKRWDREWPALEGRVSDVERSSFESSSICAALKRIEGHVADQDARIIASERALGNLDASIRTVRWLLITAVSVGGLILTIIR